MERSREDQHSEGPPREERRVDRCLTFSLCGERYAVPLLKVKEVIGLTPITPVPNTPPHLKGIMNLRGLVISVIDLRLKFAMRGAEDTMETAIIILDLHPLSIGIIVNSIDSVLGVESDAIHPTPTIESKVSADYITGVIENGKGLILLLDIEKILGAQELRQIKQSQQQKAA